MLYKKIYLDIKNAILSHIFLIYTQNYLKIEVVRCRWLIENLFYNEKEFININVKNLIDCDKEGELTVLRKNLLSKYLKHNRRCELENVLKEFSYNFDYFGKSEKLALDVQRALESCCDLLEQLRYGDVPTLSFTEEIKNAQQEAEFFYRVLRVQVSFS